MKLSMRFFVVVFCSGLSAVCFAQCTLNDVHKLQQQYEKTYNSDHPEAIVDFYNQDALLTPLFSDNPLVNARERKNYFNNLFHNKDHEVFKLQFDDKKIHSKQLDCGVVTNGIYMLTRIKKNKTTQTPLRFTMVYQDSPQGCQLISHHGSTAQKK